MCDSAETLTDPQLVSIRGAALELIRSAVLGGDLGSLPEDLAAVSPTAILATKDHQRLIGSLAA